MFLNKIKLFLITNICLIFFFLVYNDVKSYEIKIVDGDTIYLNGEKIRFSGIDTPELKQTCLYNEEVVNCGITAKKLLTNIIGDNELKCVSEGKDRYQRTLAECFVNKYLFCFYSTEIFITILNTSLF